MQPVVVHCKIDQQWRDTLDESGVRQRTAVERPESVDLLGYRFDLVLRFRIVSGQNNVRLEIVVEIAERARGEVLKRAYNGDFVGSDRRDPLRDGTPVGAT